MAFGNEPKTHVPVPLFIYTVPGIWEACGVCVLASLS